MTERQVPPAPDVPLTHAAHQLGVRYQRALDWVLTSKLQGRRDAFGRWVVSASDLDRLVKEREAVNAA